MVARRQTADPIGIERVPPHDLDAEVALLGCILREPEQLGRVRPLIAAQDFYRKDHAQVFRAMIATEETGTPPDPLLVYDALARQNIDFDAKAMLGELFGSVDSPAHAPHYARLVRDKAELRRIIQAGHLAMVEAYEPGADPKSIQQRALQAVTEAATPSATAAVTWKTIEEEDPLHDEPDWLWDRYVARERITLLSAHPGAGKSTLYYGLIAAMLQGVPFLGVKTTASSAVILSEESPSDWRARAKRFGLHDCAWLDKRDLNPHQGLDVYCEEAYRRALQIGAYLVVIDSWSEWAAFGKDEEKDAGAVRQALVPVHMLASRGMAVILVHHLRKADGEEGTGARGSGHLLGAVEAGLELRRFGKRMEGEDFRCLTVAKSRHPTPPQDLVYSHDPGTPQASPRDFVARGHPSTIRRDNVVRRVVEWVAAQPEPVSADDVMASLHMQQKAARDALKAAYVDGALEREGSGLRGDPYRYRGR